VTVIFLPSYVHFYESARMCVLINLAKLAENLIRKS